MGMAIEERNQSAQAWVYRGLSGGRDTMDA